MSNLPPNLTHAQQVDRCYQQRERQVEIAVLRKARQSKPAVAAPLPRYRYSCESGKRHPVAGIVLKFANYDVRRCGNADKPRTVVIFPLLEGGISLHYLKCGCGRYIRAEEI